MQWLFADDSQPFMSLPPDVIYQYTNGNRSVQYIMQMYHEYEQKYNYFTDYQVAQKSHSTPLDFPGTFKWIHMETFPHHGKFTTVTNFSHKLYL